MPYHRINNMKYSTTTFNVIKENLQKMTIHTALYNLLNQAIESSTAFKKCDDGRLLGWWKNYITP